MNKVAKLVGKRINHADFQGFPISIERAKGTVRKGTGPNGPWETEMVADYGYIRGTIGTDGDHVDVYIGSDAEATEVYIVNQMKTREYKAFDEQKMMLGYPDIAAAKKAYLAHYDDPRFLGSIKAMDLETFREKVMDKESKGQKVAMLTSMETAKLAVSGAAVGVGAGVLGAGAVLANGRDKSRQQLKRLGANNVLSENFKIAEGDPHVASHIQNMRTRRGALESIGATVLPGSGLVSHIAPEGGRAEEGIKQFGSGALGTLAGGTIGGELGYQLSGGSVGAGALGALLGGATGGIAGHIMRARRAEGIHSGRRDLKRDMRASGKDISGVTADIDRRVRRMGVGGRAGDLAATAGVMGAVDKAGIFGMPVGYVQNRAERENVQDYGNAARRAVLNYRNEHGVKSASVEEAAEAAEGLGPAPQNTIGAASSPAGRFGIQLNRLMSGAKRKYTSEYAPKKFEPNPAGIDAIDSSKPSESY